MNSFETPGKNNSMEWEVAVPFLSNKHIMKQVFWSVQLAIGFVLIVVFLIQAMDPYTRVTLEFILFLGKLYFILLAILTVCLILGSLLVMGIRYEYIFSLDHHGIRETPGRKQGKKNAIANTILILGGLLSRNPGLAGAGMIAQSRQQNYISWKDINKIEVDTQSKTIILKKNKRVLMMVFCTTENFDIVREKIKSYIS